jgi:hypothetical protein
MRPEYHHYMLRRAHVLALAAVLCGCSMTNGARDAENLQVAVFIHQIDLLLPPSDFSVTPTACLAIDDQQGAGRVDASPSIVRRVAARHAARPASACEARPEGPVVREGGAPAALFTVGPIQWVSRDEAHVKARHQVSFSRQGQAVYRAVREGDGWNILGAILEYAPF